MTAEHLANIRPPPLTEESIDHIKKTIHELDRDHSVPVDWEHRTYRRIPCLSV